MFDEEGNELGLYDIAKHFNETYPEDIFITGPHPIPEIRDLFKKLLELHEKTIRIWCTQCNVILENKGIALDCPEDGTFYGCPKCNCRIAIFEKGV